MIQTKGLSKTFWDKKRGEIRAVLPADLNIRKGEVFGLLGPNGAGKTTFLRMLATILTPTAGTAVVNGSDIDKDPERVKQSIGYLSGNTRLYGRLSPRELLIYFGELHDMQPAAIRRRSEAIFELLEMTTFIDQRIDKLSTGQTQKTSIARCMLHDPPIYILDEPTLGLDVVTSRTILEFIRSAAGQGKTVLLSTHIMEEAEHLCDRIGLLHLGNLFQTDTIEGFQKSYRKKYLGDIFLEAISQMNEQADELEKS